MEARPGRRKISFATDQIIGDTKAVKHLFLKMPSIMNPMVLDTKTNGTYTHLDGGGLTGILSNFGSGRRVTRPDHYDRRYQGAKDVNDLCLLALMTM